MQRIDPGIEHNRCQICAGTGWRGARPHPAHTRTRRVSALLQIIALGDDGVQTRVADAGSVAARPRR
jgi:hypothetical protein